MRKFLRSYGLKQRGFTLIELLIVCLLITISLAMSLPTLQSSFVSDQLAAGSRKVISLIKSARSRAVRDGEPQLVLFDLSEKKVWYRSAVELSDEEKEDQEDKEDKEKQGGKIHSQVALPESINIEEIKQAGGESDYDPLADGLWVSKQGYMDKTFIRLTDDDNKTLYLIIQPFFFDIQVEEEFAGFD